MESLRALRFYCAKCDREITDLDRDDNAEVECPRCGALLRATPVDPNL